MSRVLYVDDDEALCFLMSRVMQDTGHEVTTCGSGAEALQLLEQSGDAFQLVVSDMNMPGMSGLEFTGAVRGRSPELPVVLISGFVSNELQQRAEALGVRKLLLKPNGIQELVRELVVLL